MMVNNFKKEVMYMWIEFGYILCKLAKAAGVGLGGITYIRQHSPFPAVSAMVLMLLVQIVVWYLVI
jgi:hypothetical protein